SPGTSCRCSSRSAELRVLQAQAPEGEKENLCMKPRSFQAAALAAGLTLLMSSAARASPGSGISGVSTRGDGVISGVVNVNKPHVVQLRTYRDLRVFDQELSIGPLGHTGWHRHPGPVLVTVVSGTFRFQFSDC